MFQIIKLGQRITRNQAFGVACIHARDKRVYGIAFERIAQPSPNKLCHAFVCIRSFFPKRLGQYPQFVVPRKQGCLHASLQSNGQSVETFALPNPPLLGLFACREQLTAISGEVGKQFGHFGIGHHARVRAAFVHKSLFFKGANLSANAVFFFHNQHLFALFSQGVCGCKSGKSGSYYYCCLAHVSFCLAWFSAMLCTLHGFRKAIVVVNHHLIECRRHVAHKGRTRFGKCYVCGF